MGALPQPIRGPVLNKNKGKKKETQRQLEDPEIKQKLYTLTYLV